ncbi:hypothetical protein [Leucobacter massiliensis]|uniref:Uncharacterized protein n=1 Tax=Leucobacter massiliensis TaxID=1686285 RepID=A0A2S9QS33_9MICO|nr:hypothetical protein [Leucobacter massiliensis]PRI12400.1 hypothetical protein B4915_01645 [Leucobacter massiliensis]
MNAIPNRAQDGVWIVVSDYENESRIVALCNSAEEADDFCEQHKDTLEDLAFTFFPFGYRFGGGSRRQQ